MKTHQGELSDDNRRSQLDAALADYLATLNGGTPIDRDAWLARYPHLAPELAERWHDLQLIGLIGPSSGDLVDAANSTDLPTVYKEVHSHEDSPALIEGSIASLHTTVFDDSKRQPSELRPAFEDRALGRYNAVQVLGRGGFGQVFLARDTKLRRLVAVKVPYRNRIAAPEVFEQFLVEAQTLARLDHPNIVPVYDVGRTSDGRCYIVSRYIKGTDLAVRIKQRRPSLAEAARLIEAICEAAHHAHIHDLVHRDIKPSNVLLDETGRPYLTDFGLALRDDNYGRGAGIAGTPAYMSPEQARGEGHRVDGRSDVFSLGVMFYLLLVGRLPFRGENDLKLMDAIATCEPRPPRQVDDAVPKEMERICLKALSKRASERYTTARDMAEDIRHYLDTAGQLAPLGLPPSPQPASPALDLSDEDRPLARAKSQSSARRSLPLVSKGLRSFDEQDARFFLDLLPGSKDRHGLPETLSFWLTRIEAIDADRTFRVGMIYGSSGCGKSSFVKAGLLPCLAEHVSAVYVEAAPGETENRLLRALLKACPALSIDHGLVDAMAGLRRERPLGRGRKVLIVLDQFEQWLLTYRGDESSELYSALRQCDGESVQAILLVRDDFWVTASRFMRNLDLELMSDRNMAAVDLFDRAHARKVLMEFGRGYGALPVRSSEFTRDQVLFLDEAVEGLARDDKIIPVRLAVFAEMIKSKPWTLATLKQVGGADGLGVTFLEETFCSAHANPRHSLHQKAAQAVLKALLPPSVADIKGEARPEAELREVSGYADRPREFAELAYILVVELRLISLADPEGKLAANPATDAPQEASYQLTHDYLIQSIRAWMDRKSRVTWKGRAEVLLADRAALWERRPERRQLPSLPEFFYLNAGTPRRRRAAPQAAYLRAAGRYHGGRFALLAVAMVALGAIAWDGYGRMRARAIFNQLLRATPGEAPRLIEEMAPLHRWTDPLLRGEAERARAVGVRPPIGVSIALLPTDPQQAAVLQARLLEADPTELQVVRSVLSREQASLGAGRWNQLRDDLWKLLADASLSRDGSLRAACALAEFAPADPRWAGVAREVVECLVAREPIVAGKWIDLLAPAMSALGPEIKKGFLEQRWPEKNREVAAAALARDVNQDLASLITLTMQASPSELAAFIPALRKHPDAATRLGAAFRDNRPLEDQSNLSLSIRAKRSKAAAALALLGIEEDRPVIEALQAGPDPTMRTHVIHRFSPAGINPSALLGLLKRSDLAASVRQGLILALGTYDLKELSARDRQTLIDLLDSLFHQNPDAGIHSAAGWLLARSRSGVTDQTAAMSGGLVTGRGWSTNDQGQTFAIFHCPFEFSFLPETIDAGRQPPIVRPARSFCISTTEVTREQYTKVLGPRPPDDWGPATPPGDDAADYPATCVDYFDAVRYCRVLSEIEKIPEAEMCYPPVDQIGANMRLPPNYLNRTGYRLPTEAEWFVGCYGNSRASFPFGFDPDLIDSYVRHQISANNRVGHVARLMPNDVGLFDVLGNVYEWCEPFPDGIPLASDQSVESLAGAVKCTIRGGGFRTNRTLLGSVTYRLTKPPSFKDETVGFRLARTCP